MKILVTFLLVMTIMLPAFSQKATSSVTGNRDTVPARQRQDSVPVRARLDSMQKNGQMDTIPELRAGDTVRLGDRDSMPGVSVTGKTVVNSKKPAGNPDSLRPRKAAIRSAILPGLGQIYNRKYWKVPIVYAAVGIPAYLIFDNKRWYDRARYALAVAGSATPDPDSLAKVHPELRTLTIGRQVSSIRNYRNEFRKNMDYSILITLLFWGLNVIDATVDAHLRGFDVSDEITLRVKPVLMPGTMTPGVSFVFNLRDGKPRNSFRPNY